MKRHGHLWEQMVSWENLLLAARKSRRGKRDREVVRRFHFHEEVHLLRLQQELNDGAYRPGAFHTHWITRPKARLISAAPYRDRVVHHVVMNVLEPILDRYFHRDSFACRKGRGTHAASRRLQQLMRRNRYAVHCDIQKFFPSVDHLMLKILFRRRIKDQRVLSLLDMIVDQANEQESVQQWYPGDDLWTPLERRRGLPIGNLTSQWFANWYLDDLDYFVTNRRERAAGGYVRYCDDFIILDDDRSRLREIVSEVRMFLSNKRLRLHEEKLAVAAVRTGLKFVGYRTWRSHRLLPKQNVRQFRRRLRWTKKGILGWSDRQHGHLAPAGKLVGSCSERQQSSLDREVRAGLDFQERSWRQHICAINGRGMRCRRSESRVFDRKVDSDLPVEGCRRNFVRGPFRPRLPTFAAGPAKLARPTNEKDPRFRGPWAIGLRTAQLPHSQ